MARSHARIFTVIWDDDDFVSLSALAQRCYMMLLTQPNLGHAGVLPTTTRRWTLLCDDEDEARLLAALNELAATRFIVMDDRTEELLVRTLIRNDGVWKQPKVLAVAIHEAASIRSALLRACVADELGRIDCAELQDKTRPEVEALLKDLPHRLANARLELGANDPADPRSHDLVQGGAHPPADPLPYPPADGGAHGDRVRARASTAPTPSPSPAVQLPAAAGRPQPAAGGMSVTQRSKRLTDAYAESVPMCKWPAVNAVVIRAINAETWTDDAIGEALLRMAAENRSVTIDALRTELSGFPPPRANRPAVNAPRQSTTDLRVAQAQALKAELVDYRQEGQS